MAATPTFAVDQTHPAVLVASSNDLFRERVQGRLQQARWAVEQAHGGADALAKIDPNRHAALLVDSWLADLDVPELVRMVKLRCPQVVVFLVDPKTGQPQLPAAAKHSSQACDLARILQSISGETFPSGAAGVEPDVVPAELEQGAEPLPGMIGSGKEISQMYRLARLVAPRKTTVLITGETGTGKELVARGLHQLSPRAARPFVVVNCAAIPEALLEAEMFGHMRGAFTGAVQTRQGLVQAAHGGTLFLDEIGDMPPSLQAKLLRFLQEGEIQRLGSTEPLKVDVRVVAATHANLEEMVRAGKFRQDLYYRLSVFPLALPRLRERPEDILVLGQSILERLCGEAGVGVKTLVPAVINRLQSYHWPGNVRELQHQVERAFILSEGRRELQLEDFPAVTTVQ